MINTKFSIFSTAICIEIVAKVSFFQSDSFSAFILFYDFLFRKLSKCSFPPDPGAHDVIDPGGEEVVVEGIPYELHSYLSQISLPLCPYI